MKFSTLYFENYAILSLCRYLRLSITHMKKSERPDWIYRNNRIGIEVTRAIPTRWAQFDNEINEHFCNSNKIGKTCRKGFNGFVDSSYKSSAYSPDKGELDFSVVLDELLERISVKEDKKDKYIKCKEAWLYVFTPTCMINEYEINKVLKDINHTYDKIFINTQDKLYVICKDRITDVIDISEEDMNFFKEEALNMYDD